jgi:hypothetical protein
LTGVLEENGFMVHLLRNGLLLFGVVLLGAAGVEYFDSAHGNSITIDDPDREVQIGPDELATDVAFRIRNATYKPVQIVGLRTC